MRTHARGTQAWTRARLRAHITHMLTLTHTHTWDAVVHAPKRAHSPTNTPTLHARTHTRVEQVYQSAEHFLSVFHSLRPLLTDIVLPVNAAGDDDDDDEDDFDVQQTMKDVNRERCVDMLCVQYGAGVNICINMYPSCMYNMLHVNVAAGEEEDDSEVQQTMKDVNRKR
jgi:hypothetical protein